MIFPGALGTQGKGRHGGFVPVIGDILYDRVTGTAIGAVDKGIMITAVLRVLEFPEAVGTGGHIRRNKGRAFFPVDALADLEFKVMGQWDRADLEVDNFSQRRGLVL
jgi:hypothetical protein